MSVLESLSVCHANHVLHNQFCKQCDQFQLKEESAQWSSKRNCQAAMWSSGYEGGLRKTGDWGLAQRINLRSMLPKMPEITPLQIAK